MVCWAVFLLQQMPIEHIEFDKMFAYKSQLTQRSIAQQSDIDVVWHLLAFVGREFLNKLLFKFIKGKSVCFSPKSN